MNQGWLELESDPGLFTLLLEDFGVHGIQVEEVYDLQKPIEGQVFGFIFLFRWIEERRSRRKITSEEESFIKDDSEVNSIFFAEQIIPNSCATHALLSVLLNCENVNLGTTLFDFKEFTGSMNPEDKGVAIGNMPALASAHNSHARLEPRHLPEKQLGVSTGRTMEAFHFVSYVPIKGRLLELDGLKKHPIDHGLLNVNEDWTEKFRRVILERLGEQQNDIHFNLMAVVPDRRHQYENKLERLRQNKRIVMETLEKMIKATSSASLSPTDSIANARQLVSGVDSNKEMLSGEVCESKMAGDAPEKRQPPSSAASPPATSLPAALDSHNYAKSPLRQDKQQDSLDLDPSDKQEIAATNAPLVHMDSAENSALTMEQLQSHKFASGRDQKIKIQISVTDEKEGHMIIPRTVSMTDVTKPLVIETKFGGSSGPSSESTDTASEAGSAFNSPNTPSQSSPLIEMRTGVDRSSEGYQDPDKIIEVIRQKMEVASDCGSLADNKVSLPSGAPTAGHARGGLVRSCLAAPTHGRMRTRFSSQQGFKPADLVELMKNVDHEIEVCEINLKEEKEKRKKYKIDDCRRTHNYDRFIFTFLSMLANQGHLANLVEQNKLFKGRTTPAAKTDGRKNRSKRK